MPRAMWKGAISFGLVHIPVELHSASRPDELDLTMLDRRDFAPVGFRRYNKRTGEEVTWDNIVKGYEYQDGEYVVLSDEDLKRANVEAAQTIAIQAFVDAADIPLIYYEQPYYLAPSRGGAKVYALLRETLRQAGKVGVASVVIRTRQHLCALVCIGDAIVLNTLRYASEIRTPEGLDLPAHTARTSGISERELDMALSLVEGMAEPWKPEQYRDTYRDDLLALIEKKIAAGQTKTITAPEPGERETGTSNVVDLVALLQNSLRGKSTAKAKPASNGRERDKAEKSEKPEPPDKPEKAGRTDKTRAAKSAGRPAKKAEPGPERGSGKAATGRSGSSNRSDSDSGSDSPPAPRRRATHPRRAA